MDIKKSFFQDKYYADVKYLFINEFFIRVFVMYMDTLCFFLSFF